MKYVSFLVVPINKIAIWNNRPVLSIIINTLCAPS